MPLHLPTLLLLTTQICREIMHALNFEIVEMAPATSIYKQVKRIAHVSSSYLR